MNPGSNTALCFSGQGAQRVGMFKNFYETLADTKEIFDVASKICDFDLAEVIFQGPEETLNRTEYTQPCVLACDIVAGRALAKEGFEYGYVAGFSLGEYAALYMAGSISLEDVFKLIKIRAAAMQDAVPLGKGGMLAVKTDDFQTVEEICARQKAYVSIANYNSLSQVVVAGENEGIEAVEAELGERMIRSTRLRVSAPFHCKMMEPAKLKLEEAFKDVSFATPKVPIVLNYDGAPETCVDRIKEKVLLQTMSPVRWVDSVKNLKKLGVDFFVECGPGNTLTKLIKNILPDSEAIYVNNSITLENALGRAGKG